MLSWNNTFYEPQKIKLKYEIKSIGPIHLTWGKRRRKNDRGKLVKEYYIKNEKKHLIWVEWLEPFKD